MTTRGMSVVRFLENITTCVRLESRGSYITINTFITTMIVGSLNALCITTSKKNFIYQRHKPYLFQVEVRMTAQSDKIGAHLGWPHRLGNPFHLSLPLSQCAITDYHTRGPGKDSTRSCFRTSQNFSPDPFHSGYTWAHPIPTLNSRMSTRRIVSMWKFIFLMLDAYVRKTSRMTASLLIFAY